MPVPINSQTARLLTSEGREAALAEAGVPDALAKLAVLLSPDPTMPSAFGTLRLLDAPVRKIAPLARARLAQVLGDLGDRFPDRVWQFLQQHPQAVEVRSVPRIPTPPGSIGRIAGQTQFPPPPLRGPIQVAVHQRAPDRAGVLAHELTEAAAGLAGKLDEPLPGLIPTYGGHGRLFFRYGPERMDSELLPMLFDHPKWVKIHDQEQVLRGLADWFALPSTGSSAGALR
jgi:hypothetical protein